MIGRSDTDGTGQRGEGPVTAGASDAAVRVVAALRAAGETVAAAESVTGGLVTGALVSVPGASVVVRGGVVAYATDLKTTLLGVARSLLDERGAVDPDVAAAMAVGVRDRLAATYGLATTGVAGPDPADGQPVGTVYVAVAGGGGTVVRRFHLDGRRPEIRQRAVSDCLTLLLDRLRDTNRAGPAA